MSETPRSIFREDATDEDERLYFNMVDAAFKAREHKVITNGKPAHAVYLLHKLLDGAERTVCVYTGKLMQTFGDVMAYGDPEMAASAVKFLEKAGTKLAIVVADGVDVPNGSRPGTHPFIKAILDAGHRIKGEWSVTIGGQASFMYHFLVMDERALRIEVDTDNAQAYANFADPTLAKKLAQIFDRLQESGRGILPPTTARPIPT